MPSQVNVTSGSAVSASILSVPVFAADYGLIN